MTTTQKQELACHSLSEVERPGGSTCIIVKAKLKIKGGVSMATYKRTCMNLAREWLAQLLNYYAAAVAGNEYI